MADLSTVHLFFDNADAYSAFLARVEVAIVEKAVELRGEDAPEPVTGEWAARQAWAVSVFANTASLQAQARRMLPALAVKANDAGLIDEDGEIDATDEQIRGTITDAFVDLHVGYVQEVPETP